MPISFGRGGGPAVVTIDHSLCSGCGLCAAVCFGGPLSMQAGRPQVNGQDSFGCIGCGQCAAVCPEQAIIISGRDLFPADLLPLPARADRAGYPALYNLLLARRSTRSFLPRPVETEAVERILQAASTAPMGLPPSEVSVLLLPDRERVAALRSEMLAQLRAWRWLFSRPALALMRPWWGKENDLAFRQFIVPALDLFQQKQAEGEDWFFYGAPLGMFFYSSGFADPADAYIAATYAMLAGEAQGLGSCMLGFPGYVFQYSGRLRRNWGLPARIHSGLMVIFGYPAVGYSQALRRHFARVHQHP